jgi:hypothetical protein
MPSFFKRTKTPGESEFDAEKIFCVGLVKTGTTSIHEALKQLGYRVGDQHRGELLLGDYCARNFKPIIDFCLTADAFQDAPFSFPFTYLVLDQSFPNAKFVLSVRDDVDQWYRSLVRFHGNLFAAGRVPSKEDLIQATYCYPGFVWEAIHSVWNTPEDDPYHKPTLAAYYQRHNESVRDYFRTKSNFLEINLSDKSAYGRLCKFLGKEPVADDFPWLNASLPLTDDPYKAPG